MSELTNQLRSSRDQWNGFGVISPTLIEQAADRIDALEAALRNIRGAPVGLDRPNVGISDMNVITDMRRIAHEALESS